MTEILRDSQAPHSARVSAASTLLDRGWGRAPQDVRVKGDFTEAVMALISRLDSPQPPAAGQAAAEAESTDITKH